MWREGVQGKDREHFNLVPLMVYCFSKNKKLKCTITCQWAASLLSYTVCSSFLSFLWMLYLLLLESKARWIPYRIHIHIKCTGNRRSDWIPLNWETRMGLVLAAMHDNDYIHSTGPFASWQHQVLVMLYVVWYPCVQPRSCLSHGYNIYHYLHLRISGSRGHRPLLDLPQGRCILLYRKGRGWSFCPLF